MLLKTTLRIDMLLKTTLTPEKVLEIAVSIEQGIRSQLAIQARQPTDSSTTPFIGREVPVMEILSSCCRGLGRTPTTHSGLTRGNNRLRSNYYRTPTNNCRNCGQPWDINNRAKCQAIGQTCRRCNKLNHYANVCISNLNRPQFQTSVDEVSNQGIEHSSHGINMISLDPEVCSSYDDSLQTTTL